MPTSQLLEVVVSLSDDARDALLDAFGSPSPRPESGLDLARAAFERRLGPKLSRALLFVARFGTARGRDAFVEAARVVGDRRADEWPRARPADVAATVALQRATGKGQPRAIASRLAKLALLRLERELSERPTYELLSTTPLMPNASTANALRRGLKGDVVDLWTHVALDGTLHVALFTRLRTTVRLTRDKAGKVGSRAESASVAIDTVEVSSDGTRVAITAASRELVLRVAQALSLSLRPSFTLKPLQGLTATALARMKFPAGVRRVAVVARRARTPDGGRTETRAGDVLAEGGAMDGPRAGYIDRATIRVTLEDGCTADAFLQLPHRVEVSDPAGAPAVRAVLGALHLFEPGALPDDARSLAPLEHADWRWRRVVGDAEFESLVARKILVRAVVAHVATEEARMHGASYVVRAVPGEAGGKTGEGEMEYALAEDPAYGARLVTPAARAAWRMDREALAAAMSANLGSSRAGGAAAIAADGLLDLGTVTLASGKLRFVYALGAPPKGWLASVRRACGMGVTPVVLVPRGHDVGDAGFVVVELDVKEQLGARNIYRALGRAAEALDVANEVEAWRNCDEDVVIDAATERVWVRGVLVTLSDLPYRLILLLARAGRVVATKDLGAKLSAGDYPDEAARRLKGKLESQVRACLRAEGDPWDVGQLVVTEGKKGYRLGVTARVIDQTS
jgi:hypothetical protein